MHSREPDVSVVIPTFHRERQVVEAALSALMGGVDNLEVLVVDDSPEQSARASVTNIDDARIRYLTIPTHSGGRPALVRNYALERARGRYVYFLDDDDEVWPGALADMAQALDRDLDKGVAFGEVRSTGPDREERTRYDRWWSWAARTAKQFAFSSWLTAGITLFRGTLLINSTCLIRRTAAVALGGYDPSIEVYEDVDFFARGIRRFGHVYVDRPVLLYGTGQPSMMHNLDWEKSVLDRAHRRIHDGWKASFGESQYRALQVASKLLPIEPPPLERRAPAPGMPEVTPPLRESTWAFRLDVGRSAPVLP